MRNGVTGLGMAGAAAHAAQIFALTWAGSQVTKVCCSAAHTTRLVVLCMQGYMKHKAPYDFTWRMCRPQAVRAAGALALAPLVKQLLATVQTRLRLRSTRAAFATVLAACLLLAVLVFGAAAAAFL